MMKKTAKFFLATIVLVSLLASISGCGKGNSNATPAGQTFTVKRDSFTLEVTAAGNLALSRTEDIPVEFFYPAGTKGTIASVLVEEGDTVKEGQVLVTLDRDEWDEQLKVLRKALDTAKRNVITKTTAVKDAEMELASLKRQVTTKKNAIAAAEYQVKLKELAVKEAELKVQSANETLYKIEQVKKAQDAVEQAQQTLDFVKLIISGIVGGGLQVVDFSYWTGLRTSTQDELEQAQQELEDILAETHVDLTTDVKLQIAQQKLLIEQYQLAVDKAKLDLNEARFALEGAVADLEDAEYAVFKAEQALENARLDLAEAESALEDAQKDYDEAMSMSPEITAPFDGFVTKVNVTGGDEVLKGTIAVQIADTNKFEAEIYVSEMDIGKINIGSRATITADALTGMVFPAKVTHISPTATIQSGVVNYKVRVELEELPATMPQQMFPASDNTTTAFPPVPRMTGMSGNVTREQGDMFMRNRPSGGFFPFGSGNATLPRGMTMGTTTASQLREGLSVTVSIIVDSRTNVLVVPNGAIITEGFATYVEVIKDTGATEKRAVKTGLSNWQYTEITEGLTEGEKVKVSLTAGTSSSSLRMRSGMFFGPPPGR